MGSIQTACKVPIECSKTGGVLLAHFSKINVTSTTGLREIEWLGVECQRQIR